MIEPHVLTLPPASAITNPGPIVLPLDPFIPLPHVWLCYLKTENSFLISVYKKYLIFNLRTAQNSLTLMFFPNPLRVFQHYSASKSSVPCPLTQLWALCYICYDCSVFSHISLRRNVHRGSFI